MFLKKSVFFMDEPEELLMKTWLKNLEDEYRTSFGLPFDLCGED